jgi:hypothetical protein
MVISYGNKFLKAIGSGTEIDPTILEVGIRFRRGVTYEQMGSDFPMPVTRSPQTSFPFSSGSGDRVVLPTPPPGKRYTINSVFLSSSYGTGAISFEQNDGDVYLGIGAFPVSPRVMGNAISFPQKLLPNAVVWAYPSDSSIIYGGFFLGRVV